MKRSAQYPIRRESTGVKVAKALGIAIGWMLLAALALVVLIGVVWLGRVLWSVVTA